MAIEVGRALLSAVVGRELLQRTAEVLNAARVPVLPLKGVWLQALVYRDPGERMITDVDVLVPEPAYGAAVGALRAAGFVLEESNESEALFRHDAFAMPLDLHATLFRPWAFRLPTAEIFARARADERAFGVPVHLPDPLDAFAHLVGHHVKSRALPDEPMRSTDLRAVVRTFALEPTRVARHLHAVGMARAARYLFMHPSFADESFFPSVVSALPVDPVGERCVALAARVARGEDDSTWLGAAPGFLLERSLVAGTLALARRAFDRARLHERRR